MTEERKNILEGVALLCALVILGYLLFAEPEGEVIPKEEKKLAVQEVGREKVAGNKVAKKEGQPAERTSQKQILRNPFTATHETRTEAKAAQVEEKIPTLEVEKKEEKKEGKTKKVQGEKKARSVCILRGILDAGETKLAILEIDQRTTTLAAGESSAGITVLSIASDSVRVKSAFGEERIPLAGVGGLGQ